MLAVGLFSINTLCFTPCRGEDIAKREGVRRRPKSAKRTKSRSEMDRDSHVTLSEGSYEKVNIDDSESEDDAFYEDRGCQTGWELFVQYDQVCSSRSQLG